MIMLQYPAGKAIFKTVPSIGGKQRGRLRIFDRRISSDPGVWTRIRIHLGPWIRIQRYKRGEKAEFNQQKPFFLHRKLYFPSLNLRPSLPTFRLGN